MADLMTREFQKTFAGQQGHGSSSEGGSDRTEVRREALRKATKAKAMRQQSED